MHKLKLPELREVAKLNEEVRDRDRDKKSKMKEYADRARSAEENSLVAGNNNNNNNSNNNNKYIYIAPL